MHGIDATAAEQRVAIAVIGTITREHSVGRLKKLRLAEYLDPGTLTLNRIVKSGLDPYGIHNPGAVL